jgi:hypothetical protein
MGLHPAANCQLKDLKNSYMAGIDGSCIDVRDRVQYWRDDFLPRTAGLGQSCEWGFGNLTNKGGQVSLSSLNCFIFVLSANSRRGMKHWKRGDKPLSFI